MNNHNPDLNPGAAMSTDNTDATPKTHDPLCPWYDPAVKRLCVYCGRQCICEPLEEARSFERDRVVDKVAKAISEYAERTGDSSVAHAVIAAFVTFERSA